MPQSTLSSTDRTTLRRKKDRASMDRTQLHAILDEALIAHVGFTASHGPVVLPMTYARIDDALYLHGAIGNDLLRHAADGVDVCATVTLLDGLVLARSAFHHSMNYRCAVVFGRAERVTDPAELRAMSVALVDHLSPGRSAEARPPTAEELRATLAIRLSLDEASVKVRTGGPVDDAEDLALPVWAGVIPTELRRGEPIADPGS
ncbi:MAG TPA: pyridoxamine 5'-phosphate oxidase family protein [Acidimicrobiales bacterium]|nr:pyridoxamine 5'-phosphate oxidase family protein [Acidimicrobiales bacterium]